MKKLLPLLLLFLPLIPALAQFEQIDRNQIGQINADGTVLTKKQMQQQADSLGSNKEIPKGLKVWTIDSRFGDRFAAEPDTLPHLFMNTIFTTGIYGEYNTTGNLGAPRQHRIFINRQDPNQFIFTDPYDYVITPIEEFHFTNTLSPITNLSYNTAGDKTQGEDHFKAKFGVNVGKRLGLGFNFDYLYGRGYYSNQSTSHTNYQVYGSYLGDQYQAHLIFSALHQKVTENGGLLDDNYITHPEHFDDEYESLEMPVVLEKNWNRNISQRLFFTHRYSLGFNRRVQMSEEEIAARKFAMESKKENDALKAKEEAQRQASRQGNVFDEEAYEKQKQPIGGRPEGAKIVGAEPVLVEAADTNRIAVVAGQEPIEAIAKTEETSADSTWLKTEYVPVTSFIHTLQFDHYNRIYEAFATPDNYYKNQYDVIEKFQLDSIYDKTSHIMLRNTFAVALLEGFNKWAKAGLKIFAAHEYRRFRLPSAAGFTTFNESTVSIGGQLSKQQGKLLHYGVTAEAFLAGSDAGSVYIDADADLNFKMFGDTLQFAANAFFHRSTPTFYYRHYQSRHFWWDQEDMDNTIHSRIMTQVSYDKTHTTLRAAYDQLKNYTYFTHSYELGENNSRLNTDIQSLQCPDNISIFTLSLEQNFKLGIVNWENILTYQKSSKDDIIPLPDFNIYSNLYLHFKIAKVLDCDFGADVRYFTSYYAPDYAPAIGQFAVQASDEKIKVGGYPIVNLYANFHLKHTRFFVMLSHLNEGMGSKNYFFAPHYPLDQRILRFGLSWNFFN